MDTLRDKAKAGLRHYLYLAGDVQDGGLRRHPDVDKEIDNIIDDIVNAAVQEITEKLRANAFGQIVSQEPTHESSASHTTTVKANPFASLRSGK